MRTFLFCVFLFGGRVRLAASPGPAQGVNDLYTINVDENGNGSYSEYSPPTVSPSNLIASGTLPSSAYGGNEGIVYTLPYTINVTPLPNGWESMTWTGNQIRLDPFRRCGHFELLQQRYGRRLG